MIYSTDSTLNPKRARVQVFLPRKLSLANPLPNTSGRSYYKNTRLNIAFGKYLRVFYNGNRIKYKVCTINVLFSSRSRRKKKKKHAKMKAVHSYFIHLIPLTCGEMKNNQVSFWESYLPFLFFSFLFMLFLLVLSFSFVRLTPSSFETHTIFDEVVSSSAVFPLEDDGLFAFERIKSSKCVCWMCRQGTPSPRLLLFNAISHGQQKQQQQLDIWRLQHLSEWLNVYW